MEDSYIELAYYSKSKAFLYPILGFARNEIFRPQGSYLLFQQHTIANNELIVYYKHHREALYENFERQRITDHPRLRACYMVPDGSVFVFDIVDYAGDVQHFLTGEYSKFSKSLKAIILKYFGDTIEPLSPRPNRLTHATLYPELYQELVAKQLGVPKENLTELASKYDLDKETLNIEDYQPCGLTTPIKITTPI